MDQFCVLLQSLFTYVWFVWKYFIHILLMYLQAAVRIFLHHAVLLICYWCNMEFVGLAWMVRWEKFTHKTYDLKVLRNNQWYWMKYCCRWVMFICMIVHQGHTPCTSIRMFFFAFIKSIPFSLTNSCLLSLITMSASKEHKPGGTRTHCWACNIQTASRAVARTLIGGGGCIFIYSGSARLVSFEIKLILKEVSRA